MNIKADPTRVHSEELIVGKRATFHVYYQQRTSFRYAPCWETDEVKATVWFDALIKEIRMKDVKILKIVATEGELVR